MTPSKDVVDAIIAVDKKFMDMFSNEDAEGIAELYTEDGQLLPPNLDYLNGKAAIAAFWQGAMQMGVGSVKLESTEIEGGGDIISEIGNYSLYSGEGTEIDTGKYVVIWKQENGNWKLHRDIWNSSRSAS